MGGRGKLNVELVIDGAYPPRCQSAVYGMARGKACKSLIFLDMVLVITGDFEI